MRSNTPCLPWLLVVVILSSVQGRIGSNTAATSIDRSLQVRASVAPKSVDSQVDSKSGNTEFCAENTVLYHVNVDLQLDFHGSGAVQCNDNADTTRINNAITKALNDNFVTAVPDWEGNVGFGPVAFDAAQDITTRRLEATSEDSSSTPSDEPQFHRSLSSSCNSRTLPCEGDYCRWGCLLAPSTNCGVSTVTNWLNLEEHIVTALQDLKLDCLGDTDALQVNLQVVDPGLGAATVVRQKTVAEDGTFEDLMKILLDQEASCGDEVADDTPTKTLQINSLMKFIFFDGRGREPTAEEVGTLKAQTMAFFEQLLTSTPAFAQVYRSLSFSTLRPIYNAGTKEFSLMFRTQVEVDKDSSVTSKMASDVIAAADYRAYINDFVRADSVADIFHETFKVFWHGATGRSV